MNTNIARGLVILQVMFRINNYATTLLLRSVGMRSMVISVYVCLSVSLFVCLSVSLSRYFLHLHVTCGRGSVLI